MTLNRRGASLLAAFTILSMLTLASDSYSGQAPNPTAAAMKELSSYLARLNRLVADQIPSDFAKTQQMGKAWSFSAAVYDRILQEVTAIRDKFQTGPVRVTGFSIDLSLSPSVGIQFEFQ